ncbi:hypothetical protein FHW03_001494 [Ochrobactrum sp. RH2CCR150]|nr:hypothetical protein [Ochrobactrum sp. RH2CCR150]
MPFFNEASRIYIPAEVDFLRSCFTNAAVLLEESDHNYSGSELASCILMLYEHGLRERSRLTELAARLAHQRYTIRHDLRAMQTNSDIPEGTNNPVVG